MTDQQRIDYIKEAGRIDGHKRWCSNQMYEYGPPDYAREATISEVASWERIFPGGGEIYRQAFEKETAPTFYLSDMSR